MIGTIGRGLSEHVNFDVSREMPVEPFKGVVMAASTVNPGNELGQAGRTVWLNNSNGHLYRGNTDLETVNDLSELEERVTDLEERVTVLETLIPRMDEVEADVATLQSYFSFQDLVLTPSIPAGFGSTQARVTKSYKSVTVVIAPRTFNLSSPVNTIRYNAAIPAGYRPRVDLVIPVAYVSNGVVDTGLVGSLLIDTGGALWFKRDTDAIPSDFTGVSGWGEAITATWNIE